MLALAALTCLITAFGPRPVIEPQGEQSMAPVCQLRGDLEVLTSCRAGGRRAGSRGDAYTVDYLAGRFAEIGLAPLGAADSGFVHRFEAVDAHPCALSADSTAELVQHRGNSPCGDGRAAAWLGQGLFPLARTGEGRVEAPVVAVGHGMVLPEFDHDDYAGLDVRGKAVLILRRGPAALPADAAAARRAITFRAKIEEAQRRGAAAILLCHACDTDADEQRLAARIGARAEIPAFWVSRAAVAAVLAGRPGELWLRTRLMLEPAPPPRPTANVVGVLPGGDPRYADECVVVGAHHDHLGFGRTGSLGGTAAVGVLHPGADDNASGVAVLLQVARQLASGARPPRTIVFAAFGAGELGMQGSRRLLEAPGLPAAVTAMVNLDTVGRGANGVRVDGVGSARRWRARLRPLFEASPLAVAPRDGAGAPSDHWSFLRRGIPALRFHTGVHEHYRRPSDVAALVMAEEAVEIGALAAAVVEELAAGPALVFTDQ